MFFQFVNNVIDHPLLIAAAIVPAVALMLLVFFMDKLEREPGKMLFGCVMYGILATTLASAAEKAGMRALDRILDDENVLYNILFYFCIVAVFEEGFKYLFLNIRTWKAREFNCQFDGVVYSVFVALGFALWENISYVLNYGWDAAWIRALTAVPLHACCGVFMGVFYGASKRYALAAASSDSLTPAGDAQKSRSVLYRVLAVVVPVIIHGTYDYITTLTEAWADFLFIAFIIVVFIVSFIVMCTAAKQDRRFAEEPEEQKG